MTTSGDNDTRIVVSWLREDSHENAERVLLRALDEVDTTAQRRSWWPAWRDFRMNTYAKLIAVAAAVLVVAIGGYNLLPGQRIIGPGATPAPSPTLLARGSFREHDFGPVGFEAMRDGSSVTGSMTIGEGPIIVDLQCTRETEDGLVLIGGFVRVEKQISGPGEFMFIVIKRGVNGLNDHANVRRGSPNLLKPLPETSGCLAYLDAWLQRTRIGLVPSEVPPGSIEFGP
jgi:hypothetical protein